MPKRGQLSSNAKPRSKLQRKYNSKPAQKKNRAARNKARASAISKGTASKGDGKDVVHKKSLKSGGSKAISNTKVGSRSANRSHGGKIGNRAGKARGGRSSK